MNTTTTVFCEYGVEMRRSGLSPAGCDWYVCDCADCAMDDANADGERGEIDDSYAGLE